MCGRFTSTSSIEELAEIFDVDEIRTDPMPPRYNVAPTQPVVAVATRRPAQRDGNQVRALGTFRWGLVPSWATDRSVGARLINARAESVATKRAYRSALRRRRCLIPADAFYEWQDRLDGGAKQPWAIRLASGRPMAFAGLWEAWRDPNDPGAAPLRSCAIVTTSANDTLKAIHHRMPVVLGVDAWAGWLATGFGDGAAFEDLFVPAPDAWFFSTAVSSAVNRVTNDGPELLEAVTAPD